MSVEKIKIALIQMRASEDKEYNLQHAECMIRQASLKKPDMILLPECFVYRGRASLQQLKSGVAETLRGLTIKRFQLLARELKIFLVLGSMYERVSGKDKLYNTSVFIDEGGKTVGHYRKRHLFSANVGGKKICEADVLMAGTRAKMFSKGRFHFGSTICFDLRFPQLFQAYARKGCDVIVVPSNFTYQTGRDHWEVLLRARAIENRCYILAPNQCGIDAKGIRAYGNSMVVDPWGRIVAHASIDKEEIVFAIMDKSVILEVRGRLG